MNHCIFLRPPSGQNLSDDIVGGVLQRSKSYRSSYVTRDQQTSSSETWNRRCDLPAAVNREFSLADRKRKRQESNDSFSSNPRLLAISSSDLQPLRPEHRFERGEEQQAVITEWVQSHIAHQREIRRLRQIRYRRKKEEYTASLEEGNHQLRKEIEKLQERHRAISAAVPSKKTPWNVVVEYFRFFRFGYQKPTPTRESMKNMQPSAQLTFLQTTMAPDVVFNSGHGVESIMTNWEYFTLWFQDVEIELIGLVKSGMSSFIASITTSFTITERSLDQIFPSLIKCRDSEGLPLGPKLLGQRIVMRASTRFDWDYSYGRVVSVISESDILTPMLNILGSLEDVSQVFERSLISLTPNCGLQWAL
ncbi:hypothetical protein DD237_003135 [Peronospora effusa]|uniref:BZIP domain-containing protein n=1 Tax=Peronospora effusa TaxID=542832 RepID=A0A3R7XZC5_9STRA|nr:hypothetical protein DD237_003135 [Peronospora effusa]